MLHDRTLKGLHYIRLFHQGRLRVQSGCRLRGQRQPELPEQQGHLGLGLRVAREDDFPSVGRREMDVHHLNRPELLQHRPAREPGGQSRSRRRSVAWRA